MDRLSVTVQQMSGQPSDQKPYPGRLSPIKTHLASPRADPSLGFRRSQPPPPQHIALSIPAMAEVEQQQDVVKLFNRWTFDDVQVREWLFASLLRFFSPAAAASSGLN